MDNVIDTIDLIPLSKRRNDTITYVNGQNELVIEAKILLDEFVKNEENLTLEEIKSKIKERLIDFYKERENILKKRLKRNGNNE